MSLLDELSGKLEEKVIDDIPEEVTGEGAPDADAEELDMFRGFADSNTTFTVSFANVTADGDFYINAANDGTSRLTIYMRHEDASRWEGRELDVARRGNTLGRAVPVKIKEIDAEKGYIYVTAVKTADNLQRDAVNAELNSILEMTKSAKTDMQVEVNATVIGVYDYHVVLNIANSGAIARVSIRNWSKTYLHDLKNSCKRGDVYKINIIGKARLRHEYSTPTWEAEHLSFTADPWKLLDVNKVSRGTLVVVRCTRVDYRVNRWWAVPVDSSILPSNMELWGHMKTGDPDKVVRPEIGKTYQAMIVNVNVENKSLKIIPYRPTREDRGEYGVHAAKKQ